MTKGITRTCAMMRFCPHVEQIMEDIEYYSIPVYNFPFDEEEDDEETILDNSELRVRPTLSNIHTTS